MQKLKRLIYSEKPLLDENNFWYLFDVKKLTLLNYNNLKRYYVNLEGFLKPDNFFDLDDIDLFSDLKLYKRFYHKKKKKDSDKYT
jgi:hypothetical protein